MGAACDVIPMGRKGSTSGAREAARKRRPSSAAAKRTESPSADPATCARKSPTRAARQVTRVARVVTRAARAVTGVAASALLANESALLGNDAASRASRSPYGADTAQASALDR
jgi:hypothetical protein